jgi:predicted peroxiredoxin
MLKKIAKKEKKKENSQQITPHDAMLELMDRSGALSSKSSERGVKFLISLYGKTGAKLRDGAAQALRQGKPVKIYMDTQDRTALRMKKQRMKGLDDDRLKSIARENPVYTKLIARIM